MKIGPVSMASLFIPVLRGLHLAYNTKQLLNAVPFPLEGVSEKQTRGHVFLIADELLFLIWEALLCFSAYWPAS
jgi:hypothetical protein